MELLIVAGIIYAGYHLSKRSKLAGSSAGLVRRAPDPKDAGAKERAQEMSEMFEDAKHPLRTGAYASPWLIDNATVPYFSSEAKQAGLPPEMKDMKLQLFTGGQGVEYGIRHPKPDAPPVLFHPYESRSAAPITSGGTGVAPLVSNTDDLRTRYSTTMMKQQVLPAAQTWIPPMNDPMVRPMPVNASLRTPTEVPTSLVPSGVMPTGSIVSTDALQTSSSIRTSGTQVQIGDRVPMAPQQVSSVHKHKIASAPSRQPGYTKLEERMHMGQATSTASAAPVTERTAAQPRRQSAEARAGFGVQSVVGATTQSMPETSTKRKASSMLQAGANRMFGGASLAIEQVDSRAEKTQLPALPTGTPWAGGVVAGIENRGGLVQPAKQAQLQQLPLTQQGAPVHPVEALAGPALTQDGPQEVQAASAALWAPMDHAMRSGMTFSDIQGASLSSSKNNQHQLPM